jgi:hypothetical protein
LAAWAAGLSAASAPSSSSKSESIQDCKTQTVLLT